MSIDNRSMIPSSDPILFGLAHVKHFTMQMQLLTLSLESMESARSSYKNSIETTFLPSSLHLFIESGLPRRSPSPRKAISPEYHHSIEMHIVYRLRVVLWPWVQITTKERSSLTVLLENIISIFTKRKTFLVYNLYNNIFIRSFHYIAQL